MTRRIPESVDLTPARLSELLAANGLVHGRLRRVGNWGNHAYTDHEHVFVKTNRPGEPAAFAPLAIEPRAARWAADAGIATIAPSLEHPLTFDQGPGARIATVWPYLPPTAAVATRDALAALADAAAVITATAPPRWAPTVNWRDCLTRGTERLHSLRVPDQGFGADDRNADPILLDLLARAFARSEAALARLMPAAAPVSTHGDLHPGNLYATTCGMRVVDWETFAVGPREWEYATIAALACTWPGTQVADPIGYVHGLAPGMHPELVHAATLLRVANCLTRLAVDDEHGDWWDNQVTLLRALDRDADN